MAREDLNKNEKEVLDLTSEIKSLNRQKSNLIIENNKLAENNSKLVENQIALEAKGKEIIEIAKGEADKIKEDASAIYDKVKVKENELNTAIGEHSLKVESLKTYQKQAEELIKSNLGLQDDLTKQKESLDGKVVKLNSLIEFIQKTLEDIK